MQFYVLASTEFGRPKFKMGKFPIPFLKKEEHRIATTSLLKVDNRLEYVIDYEIEQSWTY